MPNVRISIANQAAGDFIRPYKISDPDSFTIPYFSRFCHEILRSWDSRQYPHLKYALITQEKQGEGRSPYRDTPPMIESHFEIEKRKMINIIIEFKPQQV